MKTIDLVIGQEYYMDCNKIETAIFKGTSKSGAIYFQPTNETSYIKETCEESEFFGCIGFYYAVNIIIKKATE